MRRHAGLRGAILLVCLLLAAPALAGCDQPAAIAAPYPTSTPPPTWTPASSPTATVVVPSTASWRTYTDAAYRFKAVIPPGWRVGAFLDTRADVGGDCAYDAIYFPPGDTHRAEPFVWIGMHEYMMITVTLNCPQYDPDDGHVTPMGAVTLSGVSTTLYGQDSNQEVSRVAYAQFGGHPYTSGLTGQSNQHTAITADVPLYLGVLSGFQYLGGK